jgi:hypothetical protein
MGQGKNLSELESFRNLGAKPSASCSSRPRIDVFIQLWSNKGVPKLWAHCHDWHDSNSGTFSVWVQKKMQRAALQKAPSEPRSGSQVSAGAHRTGEFVEADYMPALTPATTVIIAEIGRERCLSDSCFQVFGAIKPIAFSLEKLEHHVLASLVLVPSQATLPHCVARCGADSCAPLIPSAVVRRSLRTPLTIQKQERLSTR